MRPSQIRVFDGLRLTTEHLTHFQEAMRSSAEDIREILGLGVVYRGFEVIAEGDASIRVQPGLAFDFQKNRLVIDEEKSSAVTFSPGEEALFVCLKYEQIEDGKVEGQWTLIWDSCALVLRPMLPEVQENMVAIAMVSKAETGGLNITDLVRPAPPESASETPPETTPVMTPATTSVPTSAQPPAPSGATNGGSTASTPPPPTNGGVPPTSPLPLSPSSPSNGVPTSGGSPETPAPTTPVPTIEAGGAAPNGNATSTAAATPVAGAANGSPANGANGNGTNGNSANGSGTNGSETSGNETNGRANGSPSLASSQPLMTPPVSGSASNGPSTSGTSSTLPSNANASTAAPAIPANVLPPPPRWQVRQGVERIAGEGNAATNLEVLLLGLLRIKLAARNGADNELRLKLFEREIVLDFDVASVSAETMLSVSVTVAAQEAPIVPTTSAAPSLPTQPTLPNASLPNSALLSPRLRRLSAPELSVSPEAIQLVAPVASLQAAVTAHGEGTFSGDSVTQFGISTLHSTHNGNGGQWPTPELSEQGIAHLTLGVLGQHQPFEDLMRHLQVILRLEKRNNAGIRLIGDLSWSGDASEALIKRIQTYKPILSWSSSVAWKAFGTVNLP